MVLALFLVLTLLPQDTTTVDIRYFPILKKIPVIEKSPFRGEPFIFEVTQPYVRFDERVLSFLDIANQSTIPYPDAMHNFKWHAVFNHVGLLNEDFSGNVYAPPYLLQNLYINFAPTPTLLYGTTTFPSYLSIKEFNKQVPFSQIRLFRDKEENENIQLTFGRSITRSGRFNIAADYTEEPTGTKRSIGLDAGFDLPFATSSHFLFYDSKDERTGFPLEQQLLLLSLARKEAMIGMYRKQENNIETIGVLSDIYLHLPFASITAGFDYPNIDSSYYQFSLIDRINPVPLLYVVPRFTVDKDKNYAVSLGTGYHTAVNGFIYANVCYDSDEVVHTSFGFRAKTENACLESFLFWTDVFTEEHSGAALFYDGKLLTNLWTSSLFLLRLDGTYTIYLQPLLEKPFKNGKLRPAIFTGIQYEHTGTHTFNEEIGMNAGFILTIIDVSLYFVFDDITDSEKRQYKFGVSWDFFD